MPKSLKLIPIRRVNLGLDAATQRFLARSKAQNTVRAYKSDLADFAIWCRQHKVTGPPVSAKAVANYLSCLASAGAKASTIRRRLAAIKFLHSAHEYRSPTETDLVKATWTGIKRTIGTAPCKKKAAVTEIIRKMLDVLPDNLIGLRDKALILIGYAGAFRRSELVSLNVEDLDFQKEGLIINLPRSKTDQAGQGRKKPISYGSNVKTCPVRTLQEWLIKSGIGRGAVFRSIKKGDKLQKTKLSDQAVGLIIKRAAQKAELNPADFAGHSLRSGFATQSASNHAHMKKIMDQGWDSPTTVMGYIQEIELFDENASAMLGL